MRHNDDERGVALLVVLGVILAFLPLAAAVTLQTQLDGLVLSNFRGSAEAFYAAEAGLAHALSEIGPRADLDDMLYGPDGIGATPDDGLFPFRSPPPAAFAQAALGYDVSVTDGPASTIRLRSRGRGRHDSVREVEALISSGAPFTPGALYVDAADVAIELGEHGFLISGVPAAGAQAPVVGLAVSSVAAAVHLREFLTASSQVSGAGGSPSVSAAAGLDLDSHGSDLRSRLDAIIVPQSATNDPLGTETRPQLTIIDGDCTVDAQLDGFGILVVRGDLEVSGRLHYRGLVLIGSKLTAAESSDVQIDGTLWLYAAEVAQLSFLGTGHLRYDPAALDRTDSMIARALLHLPTVVGWREVT